MSTRRETMVCRRMADLRAGRVMFGETSTDESGFIYHGAISSQLSALGAVSCPSVSRPTSAAKSWSRLAAASAWSCARCSGSSAATRPRRTRPRRADARRRVRQTIAPAQAIRHRCERPGQQRADQIGRCRQVGLHSRLAGKDPRRRVHRHHLRQVPARAVRLDARRISPPTASAPHRSTRTPATAPGAQRPGRADRPDGTARRTPGRAGPDGM